MAAVGRSLPIPVRRAGPSQGRNVFSNKSEDVPAAPVIGSLQPPSQLSDGIPALSLPPQSPEAFSLAEIATAEYTERLIGVSSAPARTFIEAARRAGVPPGTSPTVLSVLQTKGHHAVVYPPTERMSGGLLGRNADVNELVAGLARSSIVGSLPAGNAFAKQMVPASTAMPSHGGEGGLAAALRGLGRPPLGPSGIVDFDTLAGGGDPASLVGSLGRRAIGGSVLATSFRDAAHMPPPLPMTEEGEVEEDDSEDERDRTARRQAGNASAGNCAAVSRRGTVEEREEDEEEEEEDEATRAARRAERDTRDDGVFESDL